jgi:hypothetical protein
MKPETAQMFLLFLRLGTERGRLTDKMTTMTTLITNATAIANSMWSLIICYASLLPYSSPIFQVIERCVEADV